jgi:hypothetical protein
MILCSRRRRWSKRWLATYAHWLITVAICSVRIIKKPKNTILNLADLLHVFLRLFTDAKVHIALSGTAEGRLLLSLAAMTGSCTNIEKSKLLTLHLALTPV